jgi:hypothetical protein
MILTDGEYTVVLHALERIYTLFSDGTNYLRSSDEGLAVDTNGWECNPCDSQAVSWTLLGAIDLYTSGSDDLLTLVINVLKVEIKSIGVCSNYILDAYSFLVNRTGVLSLISHTMHQLAKVNS